ncbi:MAG: PDZ domain-containing protein [Caldilineaceae bacterium]|nr:PDZ domain-containing protein [Caldilineaceae bacterium]
MQKQYASIRWVALLLALCCAVGLNTALYAADDEETPAEPGVLIVGVDPTGPAAAAGVVRGDILLIVDGVPTNDVAELTNVLVTLTDQTTVTLQIQHGDEVLDLAVTPALRAQRAYLGIKPYETLTALTATVMQPLPLSESIAVQVVPAAAPDRVAPDTTISGVTASGVTASGVTASGITASDATVMSVSATTQLVIIEVEAGSAAAAAGLQANDRIVALNGEAVTAPRLLRARLAELAPNDAITLTVTRGEDAPTDVVVTLGEGAEGEARLGVKVGVNVMVAHAMTADGQAPLPYTTPVQPVPNFYRFQQALPMPFSYWMIPVPVFAPDVWNMEQWQSMTGFMQYPQVQSPMLLAQPTTSGQRESITISRVQPGQWVTQPAVPLQQGSVTIMQGQPGEWVAQPAVPSATTGGQVEGGVAQPAAPVGDDYY